MQAGDWVVLRAQKILSYWQKTLGDTCVWDGGHNF